MIAEDYIDCRRFVLCVGHMDAGDRLAHKNAGPGIASSAVWLLTGSATANGSLLEVGLHDLNDRRGTEILYVAGSAGVDWVAFNPLKEDAPMKIQSFAVGAHTLTPDAVCYVVSVAGNVYVNSTPIPKFKYVRAFPGKMYQLDVPIGANAALVTW